MTLPQRRTRSGNKCCNYHSRDIRFNFCAILKNIIWIGILYFMIKGIFADFKCEDNNQLNLEDGNNLILSYINAYIISPVKELITVKGIFFVSFITVAVVGTLN